MKTMTRTIGAAGIALALLLSVATAGDMKAVLDAGGKFTVLNSASNALLGVQSDGNTGIGTANPTARLQIQNASGSPTLFDFGADHRNYIRGTNYFDSGDLSYFAGNVGIGTTGPHYGLSVNSSTGVNSYDGVAGLGRFVLGDPLDESGYIGVYRSAAGPANIRTPGNSLVPYEFNQSKIGHDLSQTRPGVVMRGSAKTLLG